MLRSDPKKPPQRSAQQKRASSSAGLAGAAGSASPPMSLDVGRAGDRMQPAFPHLPLPLRRQSLLGVDRQPLGGEWLKVLRRLDRELDELGHAGVVALLKLTHQDALVVDVELGALVFFDHFVGEIGHRPVPRIHPLQLIQSETLRQPLAVPAQFRAFVALLIPFRACLRPDKGIATKPLRLDLFEL